MRQFKVLVLLSLVALFSALTNPAFASTTRVEDDDLRVRFSGTWGTQWEPLSSGDSVRMSRTSGARAWISFEGTGCAVVARTGPDRGRVRVVLDGRVVRDNLSLYSSAVVPSRSVWTTSALAPGAHTLQVMVLGTRVASSSNTWAAIDAFDVDGVPGTWATPGTLVDDRNSNLVARGWVRRYRSSAIYGSSLRYGGAGAKATIRFRGNGVYWIGRKDGSSGKAEVLLDGKRVGIVGQYSRNASERRVAWSRTGLPWGEHTLTIRSLGQKVMATGGTTVDMDCFAISGTLLKAYEPTPFSYPWSTYIVIDKSSFRLHWVRNGSLIKSYPIAHGKVSTPTPNRVWRIDAKYRTDPSSVYGPRKMRLFKQVKTSSGYRYYYTAYGIHGTNQPWVIGTRASHGCIRMYNRDVLELWPQVPLNTMVVTRD